MEQKKCQALGRTYGKAQSRCSRRINRIWRSTTCIFGIDIFQFEEGLIVEHWDTIEKLIPEADAKNTNGKFNF